MEKSEKIWNRKFILLFITNLLVLAAFYASIPIIPIYCQEIGITGSKIGIVLTAMSVATILFRPVAGYLLDNFNRYHVYLLFLALFCLSFPAFILFPVFGILIVIRLYMGAVYSVCGSATMTLAGDVLPVAKITEGISRFAFTVSIGMAVGPYVGLQVQSHMNSQASFMTIFGITVAALICVSCCRIRYPKTTRKKFSLRDTIHGPALPFMFNMMFLKGLGCLMAIHVKGDGKLNTKLRLDPKQFQHMGVGSSLVRAFLRQSPIHRVTVTPVGLVGIGVTDLHMGFIERNVCGHSQKATNTIGLNQRVTFQRLTLFFRHVFEGAVAPASGLPEIVLLDSFIDGQGNGKKRCEEQRRQGNSQYRDKIAGTVGHQRPDTQAADAAVIGYIHGCASLIARRSAHLRCG